AAAVLLLRQGKAGNTVVDLSGNKISYMPTSQAIKRREVDVSEVALFESLGICFGRKPHEFQYEAVLAHGVIERHL
ncbi:MAG TPA: hypothetical protein VED67_02450, partial [Thermodesulfovibrionales bacterium]|nr:hypothetical protein [Thermodesulfovibrionales bacterium]